MKSFARDLLAKKEVLAGKVSIIPEIEKQVVVKRPVFSFKSIFTRLKKLAGMATAYDGDPKHFRDAFFRDFFDTYNAVYAPDHRVKAAFHLSSLEDECPRKLFYDLTEVTPTEPSARVISPRLQMIFDLGTWFHTYIQYLLFKSGTLLQAEVPVVTPHMASRADGIVKLNDIKYVLEIKTINSFQFGRLIKPIDKHVYQASNYAKILGIEMVLILYVNKDTCEMKEFVFKRDERKIREAEDKMREILEAVEELKVPKRMCRDSVTERALNCQYCSFCFKS